MMAARKAVVVRAGTLLVIVLGLSVLPVSAAAQQPTRRSTPNYPEACFFLEPEAEQKDDLQEERAYAASVAQVYRLWCQPGVTTQAEKLKAADTMAAAWKRLSDRDTPYNAAFHESGYFDLLALIGVTHELPLLMKTEPQFTKDWVRGCSGTCFEFWVDPEAPSGEQYIVMIFRLVNDLRHNLKKEPASEPVLDMLYKAQFTLGD
jgi:hypothetical protein